MIPELWNELGTEKIGDLNDCLECFVEEERNGIFELTLEYPNGYPLSDQLLKEKIIVVNANDTLLKQKFRIYDTKKFIDETIAVFARHISFDLMYDYVGDVTFENQSCEYALNSLFRQSQFSTHYRGYSDIVNAQNYSMSMCNILEAIGGKEGSIIDTFGTGAEILRDNTDIHVLNARGHDNGVTIEYGKNLTGFELSEDTTNLVTRILPYAKYTPEGGKETLVKGNFIDSPLINNYSHPYIKHIDYTDKFKDKETPTKEKLETLARNEYRDNKVDIPKTNFKIEFIPLSKCIGYEELEDKISICDKVTIKNIRYNVDTKAKAIKYKFDVLKDRYESMELGEPRTTFGNIIGNGGGESQVGPQGPPGPPGADGNIGDFPNSLPQTPILTTKVYGFASIELSWTYENKVYYTYELYASKTKDFNPNTFDLIHSGQSSSYLFQAKPNETWYFRVCAKNTHGERTEFSPQVVATTKKIDDLSNYVDNMAIGEALIGELSLDRGWIGKLNANYLDVKGNLSVTNGNGKRTLDIDSFGDVHFMPRTFKILIDGKEEDVITSSRFEASNNAFDFKFNNNSDNNMLLNSAFLKDFSYWEFNGNFEKVIYKDGNFKHGNSIRMDFNQENQGIFQTGIDCQNGIALRLYANASRPVDVIYGIEGIDTRVLRIGDGEGFKELSLIIPPTDKVGNFVFYTRAGGPHSVYANRFKIQTGGTCNPWSKNSNEMYSDNTKIDKSGIVIYNNDGSFSKTSSKDFGFYSADGKKHLGLYGGALHTFNPINGREIGYYGSIPFPGIQEYGLAMVQESNSWIGFIKRETDGNLLPMFWLNFDTSGQGNRGTANMKLNLDMHGGAVDNVGSMRGNPIVNGDFSVDGALNVRNIAQRDMPGSDGVINVLSRLDMHGNQIRNPSFWGSGVWDGNLSVLSEFRIRNLYHTDGGAGYSINVWSKLNLMDGSTFSTGVFASIPKGAMFFNALNNKPLDVLDSINFIDKTKTPRFNSFIALPNKEATVQEENTELLMDISNIVGTPYASIDKDGNAVASYEELLKLALKEIKELKTEVNILKEKVGA